MKLDEGEIVKSVRYDPEYITTYGGDHYPRNMLITIEIMSNHPLDHYMKLTED